MKRDLNTGKNCGDNFCYFYLHTNGDLIHKTKNYDSSCFEESDFVKCWWKINLDSRLDAWNFLIQAKLLCADQDRIADIMGKWKMDNEDAKIYCNAVGLTYGTDGNQFYAHGSDFIDLQESNCGFGDSLFDAICDYFKQGLGE